MLHLFASPEDEKVARSYIDQLRHRHFEGIEAAIDQSLAGPSLHETLIKMAGLFPSDDPRSVKLVGMNSFHGARTSKINLTYEYEFPDKWLLINVAVSKRDGKTTIVGFNVQPQSHSLEARNKFTLSGKSALQYSVLALVIAVPVFTLWALVSCIRSNLKGRKWLWIVFILLGVGKFAVNWTTGACALAPMSIQLFGASAFAPLNGPWTLAVSLPLGAAVFLLSRKRLVRSDVGT